MHASNAETIYSAGSAGNLLIPLNVRGAKRGIIAIVSCRLRPSTVTLMYRCHIQ